MEIGMDTAAGMAAWVEDMVDTAVVMVATAVAWEWGWGWEGCMAEE